MTDLVLDASVALTWCFKNEATAAADRVLERLAAEVASVPAIWHLEIANVLALSERRRRITPAHSAEFIALLETLEIVVERRDAVARARPCARSRARGRADGIRCRLFGAGDAARRSARIQGW